MLNYPEREGFEAHKPVDCVTSDSVNEPEYHSPDGCEDRDNSHSLKGENEPGSEPGPGTGENPSNNQASLDTFVDLEASIERFLDRSQDIIRSSESRRRYVQVVRRFDTKCEVSKYTRGQLARKTGKRLILTFIRTESRKSQAGDLSALRAWYRFGLDVPFPVDNKVDLGGRLAKPDRGMTPPDNLADPWTKAIENESNPYVRLQVRLIWQYGWRPSHLAHLKWRNIVRDVEDRPLYFKASGVDEGFKTDSPILAIVTPDVASDLATWAGSCPNGAPDKPILGHLKRGKPTDKPTTTCQIERIWQRFRGKWNLPKLMPRNARHWVSSTLRKGGLIGPPRKAWMGHNSRVRGDMSSDYDNEPDEQLLEQQRLKAPNGPLGIYRNFHADVTEAVPAELEKIWAAIRDNKIGILEAVQRLDGLRRAFAEEARIDGL